MTVLLICKKHNLSRDLAAESTSKGDDLKFAFKFNTAKNQKTQPNLAQVEVLFLSHFLVFSVCLYTLQIH